MAERRVPDKLELMIGILDSKHYNNSPNDVPIVPVPSSFRLAYLTYTFDDVDEPFQNYVLINRDIAAKILEDFSKLKNKAESLAIHCRAGLSRSPAVAAALNDCFSLGADEDLEGYFGHDSQANRAVYRTICRTAKELGICAEDFWR